MNEKQTKKKKLVRYLLGIATLEENKGELGVRWPHCAAGHLE